MSECLKVNNDIIVFLDPKNIGIDQNLFSKGFMSQGGIHRPYGGHFVFIYMQIYAYYVCQKAWKLIMIS